MCWNVLADAANTAGYTRTTTTSHTKLTTLISEKHRGAADSVNLCLSCFECNRYKDSDIGSLDIETGIYTPLFHPRTMIWDEHFALQDGEIIPLTPVGRVTVFLLRLNSSDRLIRRQALTALGRYPCPPPAQ